jgi:hypothetical protein
MGRPAFLGIVRGRLPSLATGGNALADRAIAVVERAAEIVGRVVGFVLRFKTANGRRILREKFRDSARRSGTFGALPFPYCAERRGSPRGGNLDFIGISARFRSGF